MQLAATTGLRAVAALLLACAPLPGVAASVECGARSLSAAETAICRDPQLARADEQTARRVDSFARRMNFGQYVGLRLWAGERQQQRERCGTDATCLAASFRSQMRFLDRLQQCLDTSLQRRACLRNTLNVERDAANGWREAVPPRRSSAATR